MELLVYGLTFTLTHIHYLLASVLGGIVIGALPGLSGSIGIVLMLPFLVYVDSATALVMMSGMFCGSMYGGSVSAILISTPGTPSAAATVLDGYPLAQQGKAGKALGVAAIASTMGGIISTLCLIFIAPQLAKIALRFGPVEYFALMVFGLTIMASVSTQSLLKGMLSGFFGLLIATIGIDPIFGRTRFTFGQLRLLTGFPIVPVLIGLFAVSEVFGRLFAKDEPVDRRRIAMKDILPSWSELKVLIPVIIGSSILGVAIGIIPATGGAIASFMAYNEARRFSKHPETFGKGNLAGIAAPEAANNGTTGGAMIPLLTLGVPGDVVTAVMLGALIMIGVRPGPLLFAEEPLLVTSLFSGFMAAQVLILIVGLFGVKVFPLFLRAPSRVLFPIILALCFLGSYSLGNSVNDMAITLAFGVLGYFMKRHGFAAPPVILGIILGPIAEQELGRALVISRGDWSVLVKSPIAIVFYLLGIASVLYSLRNAKREAKAGADGAAPA